VLSREHRQSQLSRAFVVSYDNVHGAAHAGSRFWLSLAAYTSVSAPHSALGARSCNAPPTPLQHDAHTRVEMRTLGGILSITEPTVVQLVTRFRITVVRGMEGALRGRSVMVAPSQ
jgi:hypothetical protein